MAKKIEIPPQLAALPGPAKALDAQSLISSFAKSRHFDEARALLSMSGEGASTGKLDGWLSELASWARYAGHDLASGLGWAQALIDLGANPFAHEGDPAKYDYSASFFETIVSAGFWGYAKKLAFSSQENEAKSRLAFDRLSKSPTRMAKDSFLTSLCAQGAEMVEMALNLGMDPNAADGYEPWFFKAKDAETLKAFAKGGADFSKKNGMGMTLGEALATREPAKARQAMLEAYREVGAAESSDAAAHIKALATLSATASYKEMSAQAKSCSIKLTDVKDSMGHNLLALALQKANWGLALDLSAQGFSFADKGPAGLPVACEALFASAPYSKSRKTTDAMMERESRCLKAAVEALGVSKDPESGKPWLELSIEKKLGQSFAYSTLRAWFEFEPLAEQGERPLWARLADLGQNPWTVRLTAQERSKESWFDEKLGGLMSYLLLASLPTTYVARDQEWKYEDGFKKITQNFSYGKGDFELLAKLNSTSQWVDSIQRIDDLGRSNDLSSYAHGVARERLMRAAKSWAYVARQMKIDAFDVQEISDALLSGTRPKAGKGSSYKAWETLEEFGMLLYECHPEKFGSFFMDVLTEQNTQAIKLAQTLWNMNATKTQKFTIPEQHRLLSEPGLVGSVLANHPLWRSIEVHLVTLSVKPVSPTRRL